MLKNTSAKPWKIGGAVDLEGSIEADVDVANIVTTVGRSMGNVLWMAVAEWAF